MNILLQSLDWLDFSTPDRVRFEASPISYYPFVFEIAEDSDDDSISGYIATVFIRSLPSPLFCKKYKTALEAAEGIDRWRMQRFVAQLTPLSRVVLNLTSLPYP
jgi:hypothetical protein